MTTIELIDYIQTWTTKDCLEMEEYFFDIQQRFIEIELESHPYPIVILDIAKVENLFHFVFSIHAEDEVSFCNYDAENHVVVNYYFSWDYNEMY